MNAQHLSDEAVAAFADGVLRGLARERATRHVNTCAECREAVRVQREAAYALRSASAPPPPSTLLDKLRTVPQTTPISTLPTAVAPDGSPVLATFAPMAALVPDPPRSKHGMRPLVVAAALVGLAGTGAAAGAMLHGGSTPQPGSGHVVHTERPIGSAPQAPVGPVTFLRHVQP